jgi:hypothetical protein
MASAIVEQLLVHRHMRMSAVDFLNCGLAAAVRLSVLGLKQFPHVLIDY